MFNKEMGSSLVKNSTLLIGIISSLISVNALAESTKIEDTARKANYKPCLSTVSEMEKLFLEGKNYGHLSTWSEENPQEQIFNSSIEVTINGIDRLMDLTIAPTSDGYCSVSYTVTWHSPESCSETAKETILSGFEYEKQLNKNIAAFSKNEISILIMPAGTGCLVQKKQTSFGYKKQGT